MKAGEMAASGQYSSIGLNKSLKKMGLNGGLKRPDVVGIGKNGTNRIVEVVSPRQDIGGVRNKMSDMLSINQGSVGRVVTWVRHLFR